MKGLLVWACSNCRSTMAFYKALAAELNVPLAITLWFYREGDCAFRQELGFRADEFADLAKIPVGENYEKAMEIANAHKGWHHLFGVYQGAPVYRRVMEELKNRGEKVAIISEAPCNMFSGLKRFAKVAYLNWILPMTVRKITRKAEFFVNYSGDETRWVRRNGWAAEKIIPFGYYSPAIEGTAPVLRTSNKPFHILATGKLTAYRGADVLARALVLLKKWQIPFKATITQKGPLLPTLKALVDRYELPVDLAGFVEMSDLIKLYGSCSVYVGAGRDEPWGMRLNDVLQCAAPLVVSRGMGGSQLVDTYQCGVTFAREDYVDLANKLRRLATDEPYYLKCAKNAFEAASLITPERMARVLVQEIESRFPNWLQ